MFAPTGGYIARLKETTGGAVEIFTKRPTVLGLMIPDAMQLLHTLHTLQI